MPALQPRERRALVVGGLAALLLGAYVYGLEPLLARREQLQSLLEARAELLARQERLVARRARYAEEREALAREIRERRARLLGGDKAPLAASELQKLIKTAAERAGVEVRSERVLPPAGRGGYTEVPVEVTLAGPIRGLVSFLHGLEGAPVLVSVQDVKIRVLSVAAPRELMATVAVTGYIAAGSEAEPRPARGESRRGPTA